jgi:hypothetical protein
MNKIGKALCWLGLHWCEYFDGNRYRRCTRCGLFQRGGLSFKGCYSMTDAPTTRWRNVEDKELEE